MNDAIRRELLERLFRVSTLAPDIRFGQMVAGLATIAMGPWDETLWNIDDEAMLGAVRQLETDLIQRTTANQAA